MVRRLDIRIITDSGCDMSVEFEKTLGLPIRTVPFLLEVASEEILDEELDISLLLEKMKSTRHGAKTACPSPEEFAGHMRGADLCYVITISSRLSGCYQSAVMARDMILEENPAAQIYVFDSESASAGETRVVLEICNCVKEGLPFFATVERVNHLIHTMKTRFVLDDLSNLMKNGRLSLVTGLMGMLMQIRPILADNGMGEIISLESVRGMKRAVGRLVELVADATKDAVKDSVTMVMSYCHCAERAAALEAELRRFCPAIGSIFKVPTKGLATIYANDGGIVLAF